MRVQELERSIGFYTVLGYEVVGTVPGTEFGSLTMLQLPGDEYVSIELVHEPSAGAVEPGGLNHLVIQVDDLRTTVAGLAARGVQTEALSSPDGRTTS
jgi:lactoylglutathione lyase